MQRDAITQPLWSGGVPRKPARDCARSYGVLSSIRKDNIYWFGARGFIFTSPWVVTTSQ
jgi:hypothetical protein